MKSRQRRTFSAEMKARIALEAIKEQKTIQEIASHYGVHPGAGGELEAHRRSKEHRNCSRIWRSQPDTSEEKR